MRSESRASIINQDGKISTKTVLNVIYDEIENSNKIGVIFCEGAETSVDQAVYDTVYSDFLVIPVGSCCHVVRVTRAVRSALAYNNLYAYGIIDRDDLTKKEIKRQNREGIYTTKLPFIENIICTPEVIFYICQDLNLDYEKVINNIKNQLVKILWKKFKESLPINLGFEANERIIDLKIGASTKNRAIEKTVNRENIIYTYRSKIIITVVSSQVGILSKSEYYKKIIQMLQNPIYRPSLKKVMSVYLPVLEEYDLERV